MRCHDTSPTSTCTSQPSADAPVNPVYPRTPVNPLTPPPPYPSHRPPLHPRFHSVVLLSLKPYSNPTEPPSPPPPQARRLDARLPARQTSKYPSSSTWRRVVKAQYPAGTPPIPPGCLLTPSRPRCPRRPTLTALQLPQHACSRSRHNVCIMLAVQ